MRLALLWQISHFIRDVLGLSARDLDASRRDEGKRRSGAMAGAVPGAAWSQSSPAHVSLVRGRSDRTRRPQECGADGGALGSGGLRPIAPFHFRWRVGRDASGGGTRPPRRSSGRWRSGGVGRRRYGVAEEGFAFGRRRAAIRLRLGQDGQLPDAGVADARAERSSRHDQPAVVFAGELDRRRGTADQGGRARGGARGALQARDRAQRNRSRPCSRRSLRHGAGRRRIRSFRRLPTGAGRPQTHLGGRRSKTSEGLSRRRRTGLSGRRTWTPAQATYPGPALLVGGRDVGASEMASHQLEKRNPRDRWPLPSPPFACGSPTERRSESMTKACSICPAPKPGWWASAAPRANANTPSPIFLPTSASRGSPPPPRRVGFASRRTSSSRRSWGSIISRVAPGAAYTATL